MIENEFAHLISGLNLNQNIVKLKKKIKANMLELITVTNQIKVENFFSSDLADLLKSDYISIINSIKQASNRIHNVYGLSKSGIIFEWLIVILQNPEEYGKLVVRYFHQNNLNLGYFAAVTFPAIFHQFYTAIFQKLAYRFLKSILESQDIGTFWYFSLSFLESTSNFSKVLWENFQNLDNNSDSILYNYSMSQSNGFRNLYSYNGKVNLASKSQWNIQTSQIFMFFLKCLKNASSTLSIYQQKILKKLFQASPPTCALFICKYLILRPFFLLRGDDNGTRQPSACSIPSISSSFSSNLSSTFLSEFNYEDNQSTHGAFNLNKNQSFMSNASPTFFRRIINEEILKIIEFASLNGNSPQFLSIYNAITKVDYSRFVPNMVGTHTNFIVSPFDCYIIQDIIKHTEDTDPIKFVKVYLVPDDAINDFKPMSIEIPLSNIFGDSKIQVERTDSSIYQLDIFDQKDEKLEDLLDLAFFDKFIDNELSRRNFQQKQTLACFLSKLLQRCSMTKNDSIGLNDLYGYLDKSKKRLSSRIGIHRSSTVADGLDSLMASPSLFTKPETRANISLAASTLNSRLIKHSQIAQSSYPFPTLTPSRSTEYLHQFDSHSDSKQSGDLIRKKSTMKPSFYDANVLILSDEDSADIDLIHTSNGHYYRCSSNANDEKNHSGDSSICSKERKVSFEEIDDKKEIKMIEKRLKKEKRMSRQALKQMVKERKEEKKTKKLEKKKKKQEEITKSTKKEKKSKLMPNLNLDVKLEPETTETGLLNDIIQLSSSESDIPLATTSCLSARSKHTEFALSTPNLPNAIRTMNKKKKTKRTKSDSCLLNESYVKESFLSILSEKVMVVPLLEDIINNVQCNETKMMLYCIKLNDFEYKSTDLDSITYEFSNLMNAQRILKFGKYKAKYSMWLSAASLIANQIDFMNEIKIGSAIFIFCQLCSFFFPISTKNHSAILKSKSIEMLTSKSITRKSRNLGKSPNDSLLDFEISEKDSSEDNFEYEEESDNQSFISTQKMPIPVYTEPINHNVVKFIRLALMLSKTDCFLRYITWILKILVAFPELRRLLGNLYGVEFSYVELAFKTFLSEIDMNLLSKAIRMIKENVDTIY